MLWLKSVCFMFANSPNQNNHESIQSLRVLQFNTMGKLFQPIMLFFFFII